MTHKEALQYAIEILTELANDEMEDSADCLEAIQRLWELRDKEATI